MLVLSRKPGERLIIDARITVEVLAVANNRVRLGIQAPEEVAILRQELLRDGARYTPPEGEGAAS
jgi:carbon storage regulator